MLQFFLFLQKWSLGIHFCPAKNSWQAAISDLLVIHFHQCLWNLFESDWNKHLNGLSLVSQILIPPQIANANGTDFHPYHEFYLFCLKFIFLLEKSWKKLHSTWIIQFQPCHTTVLSCDGLWFFNLLSNRSVPLFTRKHCDSQIGRNGNLNLYKIK